MCSLTTLQHPRLRGGALLRPQFRKEVAPELQGVLSGDSLPGQCLQDLPALLWDPGLPWQPSANDWAQWGLGASHSHPVGASSHGHRGSRNPHWVDCAFSGLNCSLWSPCPILLSPPFPFQVVRSIPPSTVFPYPTLFFFLLIFHRLINKDIQQQKTSRVLLIPAAVCLPSSPHPSPYFIELDWDLWCIHVTNKTPMWVHKYCDKNKGKNVSCFWRMPSYSFGYLNLLFPSFPQIIVRNEGHAWLQPLLRSSKVYWRSLLFWEVAFLNQDTGKQ